MKSTLVGKYLFKVNNRGTKTKSVETVLVSLLLTLSTYFHTGSYLRMTSVSNFWFIFQIKYKEHCSPESPYSCEIGDSSSKTGLYNITGKKKFYVDDLSPMFGHLTG